MLQGLQRLFGPVQIEVKPRTEEERNIELIQDTARGRTNMADNENQFPGLYGVAIKEVQNDPQDGQAEDR